MISIEKALVVAMNLLAITAACGVTRDAVPEERDYRVIVERNPFGLKPPPPPPTNAPPPAPPKDEILLTGITSIGSLRAYFMSKAPQGKQPDFYSLGVDERRDGLEVLGIDLANKSVRVRTGGAESVMTFASNGVKPPATPAGPPPGTPGTPGVPQPPGAGQNVPGSLMPGGHVTPPGMTAGAVTPGANATGRIRTIPSRNPRTPPAMTPGMDMNQPAVRPDPNAGVQDVLLMELQKRANPGVAFPPTPLPMPE
jgi:hypothetical protein